MAGTITVSDLARVQDVEFVTRFTDNINRLTTMLGIMQPIAQQPGTVLKMYPKATGTLESGTVAEGADIPASKYSTTETVLEELSWNKWRKETTLEAISKRGYGQAVDKTDAAMVNDIQSTFLTSFFAVLGNGTGTATGTTLQAALARTRGQLRKSFKNTTFTPVYFVSSDDITEYLATHEVTTQTAFGMTYIENFLNLGMVVEDPDITKGTLFGTATENLNIYFANPSNIDGFSFYTDATGLIGICHEPKYGNETYQTHAVSALRMFPEYADRIVKATIAAGA